MDTYRLVKLAHLAAVTLWIGGAFSMAVLILRVGRTADRAMLPSLVRHAGFYGRAVVGPASVLTLLSGMAMLSVLGLRPDVLWIQWGFAGILGHFVLGAVFIRRATRRLAELAAVPESKEVEITAARRRLAVLNVVYLSLLLSVIGAMALKPSL